MDLAIAHPPPSPRARGAGQPGCLGQQVLTCDPIMEQVYRQGLVSLKDLRALMACVQSQELRCIAEDKARQAVTRAAAQLRSLLHASSVAAGRVRLLVWETETRLADVGIPLLLLHPELEAPLGGLGSLAQHALGDLAAAAQAIRMATHPSAWGPGQSSLWDTVAVSAACPWNKATLALVVATLLPAEARISYLALRHSAYQSCEVRTLGAMVKQIMLKMCLKEYTAKHVRGLAKQLRLVAPRLVPLSLWLLSRAQAGCERSLSQQAAARAALEASLQALLTQRGTRLLYEREAWVPWLLDLDTDMLVSFYFTYLLHGFQ